MLKWMSASPDLEMKHVVRERAPKNLYCSNWKTKEAGQTICWRLLKSNWQLNNLITGLALKDCATKQLPFFLHYKLENKAENRVISGKKPFFFCQKTKVGLIIWINNNPVLYVWISSGSAFLMSKRFWEVHSTLSKWLVRCYEEYSNPANIYRRRTVFSFSFFFFYILQLWELVLSL